MTAPAYRQPEYHWCNDHPSHATDPYRHLHRWKAVGVSSGDVLYACECTAALRVTAKYATDIEGSGA